MIRSHTSTPKPSPLLALVALGVVFRFRPAWLAVDLAGAAAAEGVRADRLSRLVSRAVAAFEPMVAGLIRRGRPARQRLDEADRTELALLREVVGVARSLLEHVPLRRRAVGELLVGAFARLRETYGITQRRFCEMFGLPARTLRHWQSRARRDLPAEAPPPRLRPRPRRKPRRGRFGFDVLLPGTQLGADTTDIVAFDVGLKLMAAQDIGGRDQALYDSVIVDDHESAELVARVLTGALEGKPGAQAITDQGTPYLARCARGALEALEVEHAVQREGDPLGKATVERGFGTLKRLAAPILELTNRIARAVPGLSCPTFAKASVTLLVTALLRAYQHGARAARDALDARGNIEPRRLAQLAEQSRELARATDKSARLLLAHVHQLYGFSRSARLFVDSLRRYPLPVLQDAERAMRDQAHRDDIRDKPSYFAAIVRRLNEEHQRRLALERADEDQRRALDTRAAEHRAQRNTLCADPVSWLRYALDLIAMQWQPESRALLFGGDGFGLGHLHAALCRLTALHGAAALDIAFGALHDFKLRNGDRLGLEGIRAVATVMRRELEKLGCAPHCATADASAILRSTGRLPRPPPPNRLRI